ncbi:HAD family hydrolase [Streptomyces sp. NPDC059063]|uniref:HAD family hydrolase n=1 Tax=unclassified Streptomyces TaxID=2593676 RepID=UPI0036CEAFA6
MSRPVVAAPAAVLFDMFGVLALDQTPAARARLTEAVGDGSAAFWDAYWALRQDYDRGDLDGTAYWTAVGARIGRRFAAAEIPAVVALDMDSWGRVDGEMVGLLRALAADGTRVGLLSNISHDLAAHYERHHPDLLGLFEVLGLSCRIRSAKPEPDAYLWCARAFGLGPEQVLFVDDREANVKGAEAVGMRGHHFTGQKTLEAALGHGRRSTGTSRSQYPT